MTVATKKTMPRVSLMRASRVKKAARIVGESSGPPLTAVALFAHPRSRVDFQYSGSYERQTDPPRAARRGCAHARGLLERVGPGPQP